MRPPACATAAVRGGLALTGNAPTSPASDVADADRQQVATDVDLAARLGSPRTSNAARAWPRDWVTITSATIAATGATCSERV